MIINAQVLDLAFKGFKTVVSDAMMNAPAHASEIAMTVPSASRDETYGWLGSFPAMREWLGPRQIKNLTANGFTIQNRKFESTLEITLKSPKMIFPMTGSASSSRCLRKWGRRRCATPKNWC